MNERINTVGMETLFIKELKRFSKVWLQTVFSPLVTTSLYFLVFGVALGSRLSEIDGVRYIEFVIPGLMMLAMISNSFLNTSSSLFQSKINGTLVDILAAPIGTTEILGAYVSAAVIRGSIVGFLVWCVASFFTGFHLVHLHWVVFFTLIVTSLFAMLGLMAAIWAEKFDQLSIFPNFVLTPLTFLGGVFYSVSMLPAPWDTISRFNPILYTVNGLRFALLGVSDVPVLTCAAALLAAWFVVALACWRLVDSGWKLRN